MNPVVANASFLLTSTRHSALTRKQRRGHACLNKDDALSLKVTSCHIWFRFGHVFMPSDWILISCIECPIWCARAQLASSLPIRFRFALLWCGACVSSALLKKPFRISLPKSPIVLGEILTKHFLASYSLLILRYSRITIQSFSAKIAWQA